MDKSMNVTMLEAGLRGVTLRSRAIANNIANIETPGYKRKDVQFEDALAKAIDGDEGSVDDVEPTLFEPRNTPADATGNDVNMDTEVGQLLENSTMQKTYLRLMTKMYRQMDMAIRGE